MGQLRAIVVASLVVVTIGRASAQPVDLDAERAAARRAAEDGRCDVAIDIGARVEQLDGSYHASTFMSDPVIAACFAMQAEGVLPPPTPPPVSAPEQAQPPAQPPGPPSTAPASAPSCQEQRIAQQRAALQIHDLRARGAALQALPTCAVVPAASAPTTIEYEHLERDETPPLSGARVAGELLAGGALGIIVGGIGGAALGARISKSFEGGLLSGMAGMTLLAPVGVYLAGNSGDETGSFGAALGGSALGLVAGLGAVALASGGGGNAGVEVLAGVLFLAAPTIGATIGFNLSRKYKPVARTVSWMPTVNATPEHSLVGISGRF
jgi:hypothetical protein